MQNTQSTFFILRTGAGEEKQVRGVEHLMWNSHRIGQRQRQNWVYKDKLTLILKPVFESR